MSALDNLHLDVLLVDDPDVYEREHRCMIGRALELPWWNVVTWLSRPSLVERKQELGAWTAAKFRDNRKKKDHLEHASALLVDVDEGGDVQRVAEILTGYLAAVHSTFSSTSDNPRCRVVLPFAEPVDAKTYETTFRVVAKHLKVASVIVDEGTKDAGRLGFLPCVKAGAVYLFRAVEGDALDAHAIVAAQPPEPPRPLVTLPKPEHRDAYVNAALSDAASAVMCAPVNSRHDTLNRQAYSLARLELSEAEIAAALLPAFVAAAGEGRRHEGARTIRDAVNARVKGAA